MSEQVRHRVYIKKNRDRCVVLQDSSRRGFSPAYYIFIGKKRLNRSRSYWPDEPQLELDRRAAKNPGWVEVSDE
jgi:hypothetical protein